MEFGTWGAFHDGCVTAIDSQAPDRLAVFVEIQYLRDLFNDPGSGFVIFLSGVKELSFTPYNGSPVIGLSEITLYTPEILACKELNDGVCLTCVDGIFILRYENAILTLDNGKVVTDEELLLASKQYWNSLSAPMQRNG